MNKKWAKKQKKAPLFLVGVLFFALLSIVLLWTSLSSNNQSLTPTAAKVRFCGKYKIADGEWQQITENKHIPATKGDVTLQGYFQFYQPNTNNPIGKNLNGLMAFYFNHVGATITTSDDRVWVFDAENKNIGESSCGADSYTYFFSGTEDTVVTIVFHNPHSFGNERAIDEFLDSITPYYGIDYETDQARQGALERTIGFVFVIMALIVLGVAIFCFLFHFSYQKEMFLVGFMILMAGIYCIFSSKAIYFWCGLIALNTLARQLSVVLFMLCATILIYLQFSKNKRAIGLVSVIVSLVASVGCLIVPIVSNVYFYDMWFVYLVMQSVSVICALLSLAFNIKSTNKFQLLLKISSISLLISFLLDFVLVIFGVISYAVVTKIIFGVIFAISVVIVLKVIPQNINTTIKAKEILAEQQRLKLELQKSRVSLMLSQIKPHFIYNTLGTIGEFCEDKPQKAKQLVQEFSLYLRGNFGELDNVNPISVLQEMEHVKHYVKIESVRFPDMVITFDLQAKDFFIPALSVQPLVENAIKHGLLKLESGGAVNVKTYETEDAYCITVADNGVGFDVATKMEEKKHIGIRNIKDRLKLMCNGTLTIESEIGVGTTAKISIPKESNNESNNG